MWARGMHLQFNIWFLFSLPFLLNHGLLRFCKLKTKHLVVFIVLLDLAYTMDAETVALNAVYAQLMLFTVFCYLCKAARTNDDQGEYFGFLFGLQVVTKLHKTMNLYEIHSLNNKHMGTKILNGLGV